MIRLIEMTMASWASRTATVQIVRIVSSLMLLHLELRQLKHHVRVALCAQFSWSVVSGLDSMAGMVFPNTLPAYFFAARCSASASDWKHAENILPLAVSCACMAAICASF